MVDVAQDATTTDDAQSEGDTVARHLITSALPYINGVKHLGNLIGSMLPADVYARFLRMRGHEVLFICATDEHGTPAELAAAEAGLDVAAYCAEQHAVQADIYRRFRLSFDVFGRSSSPQNHELTQHFAERLAERGLLEERNISQVYSVADGRFLPDRYVTGTCPHCGYDRARGDQCENCTKLLDPTDLIEPRSAVSGSSELEVRDSKHLYLLQSRMQEALREWIAAAGTAWPTLTTSIAYKWLDEGLEDRGITRDLSWGVPVGRPGFEGKVFYVWFDAPIEYIGATAEWADRREVAVAGWAGERLEDGDRDWRSWWFEADDVTYTQFMAKDNIPFHTVMFPATVLGTGEPWKLPDMIKGFHWLTYYGGKFSTSQGRGVFMDAALAEMPADSWRYWLLANAPESSDASFTWDSFAQGINKDLGDVLGNFVNRALKFTESRYGTVVPTGGEWGDAEDELVTKLQERLDALTGHLESIELRKAMGELRAMWVLGNEYFGTAAPWATFKESPEAAALPLRIALNLIHLYGVVASPIVPEIADQLLGVFGTTAGSEAGSDQPLNWPTDIRAELDRFEAGAAFNPLPGVLFTKISYEQRDALAERYGGADD